MTKTRKNGLRELGIQRQIEQRDPPRHRHLMTPEELDDLKEMHSRGLTAVEIQRMLFRRHGYGGSIQSIRNRVGRIDRGDGLSE